MKKLMIFVFLLLLVGVNQVSASTDGEGNTERLPYGRNYIDFRNFEYKSHNRYGMIKETRVKQNQLYTLVVGREFVGDYIYEQEEYPEFRLITKTKDEVMPFEIDYEAECWHQSFLIEEDALLITDLSVQAISLNEIILYEGNYESFSGYEMYQSYEPLVKEGYYLVDYDNPVETSLIMATLGISDNHSTRDKLSTKINSDEYTNRTTKIGQYLIEYEVKDEMANVSIYKMHIRVVDTKKPVIEGPLSYVIKTEEDHLTVNQMLERLTITDNVDELSTKDIEIIEDTYTPNKGKVGEFEVTIKVKDQSNNETQTSIKVSVSDTRSPNITGPSSLFRYLNDPKLTEEDIRKLYQATDNVDGDITDQIVIDYVSYFPDRIGVSTLLIRATDSSGNKTVKQVSVHIIDDVSPVVVASSPVISKAEFDKMSQEDIVEWFKKDLERKGVYASNVSVLLDESNIKNKQGKSYVYFEYEVNGDIQQSRLTIESKKAFNPGLIILTSLSGIAITTAFVLYKKKR
jgi:hypothetical protein